MVREAAGSETKINQEREARFVRERDQQRELLTQARNELAAENTRSDSLKVEYDRNERALADLETTLAERMGNLGELFGVVRQASGDVQAALDDSMVSAQLPGRTAFLSDLAQRRELPTVPELRQLWSAMVTEIAESGKVVRFATPVERTTGATEEMEVVRLGVFNAVADGTFLDWDTSKSRDNLIELARQPARPDLGVGEHDIHIHHQHFAAASQTRPRLNQPLIQRLDPIHLLAPIQRKILQRDGGVLQHG